MNFAITNQEFLYIILLSFLMSLFTILLRVLLQEVSKDSFNKEFKVETLDNEDFSNSIITNGKFTGLSCRNSIFRKTNLTDVTFEDMDLTGSDFTDAILNNTRFIDCVMINVKIEPIKENNYTLVNSIVEDRKIFNPELN